LAQLRDPRALGRPTSWRLEEQAQAMAIRDGKGIEIADETGIMGLEPIRAQ
jgi:hypothetical protein